jgi:hypothetical protein
MQARIAASTAGATTIAADLDTQKQAAVEAVHDVTRRVAESHAAAREARATVTAAYDQQIHALSAATSASLAAITASGERERAAIAAAAEGERQRLAPTHDAERAGAEAHIDGLRQQTLAAGESEAAGSRRHRAACLAITADGAGTQTSGEPPGGGAGQGRPPHRRAGGGPVPPDRHTSRSFSLDERPDAVEVDVVGNDGKLWIDSKSTEPFGLDSNAWTGKAGKQGLKLQAEEMLRSASQNPVDGAPPKVAFDVPKGVSTDVKAALEAMGVEVRGPVVEPTPVPVLVPGDDRDKDGGE